MIFRTPNKFLYALGTAVRFIFFGLLAMLSTFLLQILTTQLMLTTRYWLPFLSFLGVLGLVSGYYENKISVFNKSYWWEPWKW